jgi:hypothetical protein
MRKRQNIPNNLFIVYLLGLDPDLEGLPPLEGDGLLKLLLLDGE